MESYIGITGIARIQEIKEIYLAIKNNCNTPYIGFGIIYHLNESSRRVSLKDLTNLIEFIDSNCSKGHGIIHLNGWCDSYTSKKNGNALAKMISKKTIIQVNRFNWSDSSFCRLKIVFPNNPIVLPLNPRRTIPQSCLTFLKRYGDQISGVLIDSSEGTGKVFSIDDVQRYVGLIRNNFPHANIGVAGGIGKQMNFEYFAQLKKLLPLSFDAESGLSLDGILVIRRVLAYIEKVQLMNK